MSAVQGKQGSVQMDLRLSGTSGAAFLLFFPTRPNPKWLFLVLVLVLRNNNKNGNTRAGERFVEYSNQTQSKVKPTKVYLS